MTTILCWLGLATVLTVSIPAHVFAAERHELEPIRRLAEHGRLAEALQRIETFLAQHPAAPEGRFQQGQLLAQMNRSEQAIEVFLSLTQDYPELPQPYNNLAVLYAHQGQYAKARNILLAAINTNPSYSMAHENLGDLYLIMAARAYRKALQMELENTVARMKLDLISKLFSFRPRPPAQPATRVAEMGRPAPPAPSPLETVVGLAAAADESERVLATVTAWAQAWSEQDLDKYLSFYAPDFIPPRGMSRVKWEAERRQRVSAPRTITVVLDAPQVAFRSDTQARVTFQQTYRSDLYGDRVRKSLLLHKQGEQWQIHQERVEPY